MTDTNMDTADPAASQEDQQEPEAKTFDAEYVDKLRKESAKYRTEAKANAEAAKRLAELEESQKTEAQKQAEKIAELERQIEGATVQAVRARMAAKYQIDPEDADLFLTGSDEETVEAQAKRLSERVSASKNNPPPVSKEGTVTNAVGSDDEREFLRHLTGRA